jgi:hypothetical protein
LEHLDRTPFTQEQLAWLPTAYTLCAGVWRGDSRAGVTIDMTPGRFGDVHSLSIDGECWMCTNPCDMLDHKCVLDAARGRVLLTGLGLGLALVFCSANKAVRSVTVVEKDSRVVDLVWPMIRNRVRVPEVEILVADANSYDPYRRFDFAYLDHTFAEPPPEAVRHVSSMAKDVRTWWSEAQGVLATWQ